MQPAQLDDAEPGLFCCGTGDFVTDDRGSGIAEQQIENPGRGVDRGVVARRYRAARGAARCRDRSRLRARRDPAPNRFAGSSDRSPRP